MTTIWPCTDVPGTIVPFAWQKPQVGGSRKRTGVWGRDAHFSKTAEVGSQRSKRVERLQSGRTARWPRRQSEPVQARPTIFACGLRPITKIMLIA